MRIDHACRLLESAAPRRLGPIADALGCSAAEPMPRPLRQQLGLPASIGAARLAPRGPRLSVLLADAIGPEPMRDVLRRLASRLLAAAPHRLWIAVVARREPAETAIAAFVPGRTIPTVAALVVRRDRVVDSDGQTLAALAAVPADADDDLRHLRWAELLGRSALTGRFYRALDDAVGRLAESLPTSVSDADRRPLAITAASRLLFLSFLETKGWLDGDRAFLARTFDAAMADGGGFHRRVLLPLWFGTLNTPVARRAATARAFGRIPFLNGGLFARTPEERAHRRATFGDAAMGHLVSEVLGRFRFTAREDGRSFHEAAVDPEMLGLAFESLMHASDRKASGTFYTPPPLVDAVVGRALTTHLAGGPVTTDHVALAIAGEPPGGAAGRALLARAQRLTLCDPACGSGAFLVRALELLATIRRAAGDPLDDAALRREIIARQLHGVDRNPVAVWLCELRLWLAVVVAHDEPDPRRVPPLPNLDRQVRAGDALAGGDFADASDHAVSRRIGAVRERYARATGPRKHTLARRLDALERVQALAALDRQREVLRHARRERLLAARARDLFGSRTGADRADAAARAELRTSLRALAAERRRLAAGGALPFSFATHFAAAAGAAGFDLVVGNPPWVRPHHLPSADRERLRATFRVQRDAAWRQGADDAGAGTGFAGQVDLAACFTERSVQLLKPGGTLALLVPAKLWRSLAGGGWRALLTEQCELRHVADWSDGPATFDAAVYPGIIVAVRRRAAAAEVADVTATAPPATPDVLVMRRDVAVTWRPDAGVAFDASRGAPWLLLPPPVRDAFDHLRRAGTPLARSPLGRPTLGVKCGVNDAFVVERVARSADGRWDVRASERTGRIEPAFLRPVVRGDSCDAWRLPPSREAMVYPHDADGPLPALPAGLSHWLGPWRRRLVARADLRGSRTRPWWSLFRTDAARHDRPRVVWSDFGRTPRAAILPAGHPHVPLNTCYVLHVPDDDDALAMAALLNSHVAAAWLGAIAEPARGGWRRFLGWTVAQLPVPADWPRATAALAPLAARGWAGHPPDPDTLWHAVADAYGVRPARLRPLIEWVLA